VLDGPPADAEGSERLVTVLATFRSFALRAAPTATRFAALSVTSGVILALVSTFTPVFGRLPRISIRAARHALVALLDVMARRVRRCGF